MHISLRMQTWKTLLQHSGSGIFFHPLHGLLSARRSGLLTLHTVVLHFHLHVTKLFLWAAYKIYETWNRIANTSSTCTFPHFFSQYTSGVSLAPCYLGWGFRCFSFQTKTLNIRHHSRELKVPKICLCIPFQRRSYVRVYLFSRRSILGIKG